jgi:hypothetical protein
VAQALQLGRYLLKRPSPSLGAPAPQGASELDHLGPDLGVRFSTTALARDGPLALSGTPELGDERRLLEFRDRP